jgi:hypothetical protein
MNQLRPEFTDNDYVINYYNMTTYVHNSVHFLLKIYDYCTYEFFISKYNTLIFRSFLSALFVSTNVNPR